MIDLKTTARKWAVIGLTATIAGGVLFTAGSASAYVIGGTNYTEVGPTEGVQATFTTADGGVTTGLYSNYVRIDVGAGGESLGSRLNDAFYVFTDASHNPTAPFNDASYYQMSFDTVALIPFNPPRDIKNSIYYDIDAGAEVTPTYVPAYRPGHVYSFVIDAGAGLSTLHFGVSDGNFSDNSGNYRVQVTQLTAAPEPATLAVFGLGLAGLGVIRRRSRAA